MVAAALSEYLRRTVVDTATASPIIRPVNRENIMIHTISYEGILLDVKADYYPDTGDNVNEPFAPAHWQIEAIYHKGQDISPLIDEATWDKITGALP